MLEIDYDEILRLRTEHQRENLAFVAAELMQIEALRPTFAAVFADGNEQRLAQINPSAGTQLGLLD